MTTEDDFHAALDKNPDDWQTRLVFADWLQERGDVRAEGYRALGMLRLRPKGAGYGSGWAWFFWNTAAPLGEARKSFLTKNSKYADKHNALPGCWYELVEPRGRMNAFNLWLGYECERRDIEDAVALAFDKLPAERRAELLSGGVA